MPEEEIMITTRSWLACAGLLVAVVSGTTVVGCSADTTDPSTSDQGTTTSASAVVGAQGAAEAFQAEAKACFDTFDACRAAADADLAACKTALDACLPAAPGPDAKGPPHCGGDHHGDHDGDAKGGAGGAPQGPPPGCPPPPADAGAGGGGGAPPGCPPPPKGDAGGAAGAPPGPPPGDAPPPPDGAAGAPPGPPPDGAAGAPQGPPPPKGGDAGKGPPPKGSCTPDGFGKAEMGACHDALKTCLAAADADPKACKDAFKACAHDGLDKAFGAVCDQQQAACSGDCATVDAACKEGISAP